MKKENVVLLLIITLCISCASPTKTQEVAAQEEVIQTTTSETNSLETEKEENLPTKPIYQDEVMEVEDAIVAVEPMIDLPMEEAATEKKEAKTKKILSKKEKVALVATGNRIPDGIIYNLAQEPMATGDFKGKLLVLDFWATWCGPCLREAPIFQKLGAKYKDKDVAFVGISIDERFETWKRHVERKNYTGNQFWLGVQEEQDFFSFAYSEMDFDGEKMILMGVPRYVFVSPDGIILNSAAAKPSNPKFEEELMKYLK